MTYIGAQIFKVGSQAANIQVGSWYDREIEHCKKVSEALRESFTPEVAEEIHQLAIESFIENNQPE